MPGPGPRGGGPKGFANAKKIDLKSIKRLISMLFKDYPVHLGIVVACIITSSIIGVLPSVYIERITTYIEEGLTGGWDAARPKIVGAVIVMIILFS